MKTKPLSTPPGREVDAFEWWLRFACGALLGLVVGLGFCVRLWPLGLVGACLLVLGAMAVGGFCAARWGDDFWARIRRLQ